MKDIALVSEGTRIYFASCRDDKYPLNNIIDGKWDTFWPTSGLFPHSFIVTFRSMMKVDSVALQFYNVKLIKIDKSKHELPTEFEKYVGEQVCEHTDRRMYTWNVKESCVARHLKIIILQGFDHFVAVHNMQIMADSSDDEKFAPTYFSQKSVASERDEYVTMDDAAPTAPEFHED